MSNFLDLYTVHDLVASNSRYELFLCKDKSDNEYLYQSPKEFDDGMDKNAMILDSLNTRSKVIQEQTKNVLNYHLGFPRIVDRFSDDVKSSYVIGFSGDSKVSTFMPLIKLCKDGFRVDLRTSAWIMGKLLKIVSFAHNNGIEVVDLTANNVLIQPDHHYTVVFDWSKSEMVEITPLVVKKEIKKIANLIIKILGGDLEAVKECDADSVYIDYIEQLARIGDTSVIKVHTNFYSIVDSLCSMPDSVWKSGFHKFTSIKVS